MPARRERTLTGLAVSAASMVIRVHRTMTKAATQAFMTLQ
jgi:hypothetical protein